MSRPRPATELRALRVRPDRQVSVPDVVATEEPLQILVAGPGQEPRPLVVTMRTPGHDFELACGFLISEGLVERGQVRAVGYCETRELYGFGDAERWNVVSVVLATQWDPALSERNFSVSASCGVCGKTSIDQLETGCRPLPVGTRFPAEVIPNLPEQMRRHQRTFERTGGLHAAGLFGPDGEMWCVREDVGRHNAVDKVIGATELDPTVAASATTPGLLAVSGRVSFEIVQKAAQAGFPVIAAVSAPSSLAVAAADRLGLTLAAFVRGDSYNVYTHPERLVY